MILSIVPKLYLNAIKSLSFITSLEFMYKTAIIIGMIVAFSISGTAESLIWGQIIALIIFMPVEYFSVNKLVLKENAFKETILNMLPSILVMAAILSNQLIWSLAFVVLGIAVFRFIYMNPKSFNIKLLIE